MKKSIRIKRMLTNRPPLNRAAARVSINLTKIFMLVIGLVMIVLYAGCKSTAAQSAVNEKKTEKYYCPMHPEVTADKPGICPICHMDLVKQTESSALDSGLVTLSKSGQLAANVQTLKISSELLYKEIKGYSVIEIPEQNRKSISAKFNGRVEKLIAAKTGDVIKKGDPLFVAYSPDVYKTAGELLLALASMKNNDVKTDNRQIYSAARKRLELYGLGESSIAAIEKKGEPEYMFMVPAPVSGVILKKKVLEGAYFTEGTELYEVADLGTLWNVASVYEQDAVYLKAGMTADINIAALPGEKLTGKLSFISPVVEAQNRTIKVRIELENRKMILKPQMYGETVFKVALGRGIAIPQEAVLFTGKRNLVWLKTADEKYSAVEVIIGNKLDRRYQILSGLADGDEILINGSYLLDSETQLKAGGKSAGKDVDRNAASAAVEKPRYITKDDPLYKKLGVYNKRCPVQGDEIEADAPMVLYRGKIIGFCCAGCDKKFIADPEKYFSKISPAGR